MSRPEPSSSPRLCANSSSTIRFLTQADCLRMIVRAEMRMADEIDRGQERGEVARAQDGTSIRDLVQGSDNGASHLRRPRPRSAPRRRMARDAGRKAFHTLVVFAKNTHNRWAGGNSAAMSQTCRKEQMVAARNRWKSLVADCNMLRHDPGRLAGKSLILLARPAGFEPATYGLEVRCSIQLS